MTHISFSELKVWAECPFKHKLVYKDRIRAFRGNEFTAFGSSLHFLCESMLQHIVEEGDREELFELAFDKELSRLPETYELREKLVEQMREQAKKITPFIMPALTDHFDDYEVFSTEEKLFEKINEFLLDNYLFKGYIDLVLKTSDGKYHIIDWKTCSWGWDARKKTDKLITYQLTLYKKFFCQKHDIDPELVETHFALLKRTAKNNNVEVFKVSSGVKKTNNAMALLTRALANIAKNNNIKNRLSCDGCEFYKTNNCP